MSRKLLPFAAIAFALLSGCATYDYRGGAGDYYYGQPSTGYYDPYGYGYGYYSDYGYPGYTFAAPYWYGGIDYRYYVPVRVPRHDGRNDNGHGGGRGHHGGRGEGNGQPPRHDRPDRPRAPWRDLGNAARQGQSNGNGNGNGNERQAPAPARSGRPTPMGSQNRYTPARQVPTPRPSGAGPVRNPKTRPSSH